MKIMLLLACAGVLAATAATAAPESAWMEVTRPMVACGGPANTPDLAKSLADAVPKWRRGESLGDGCDVIATGKKLMLDDESPQGAGALKAWEFTCTGCVPWMSPIYLPTREQVGAYLRPTTPPEGWTGDE